MSRAAALVACAALVFVGPTAAPLPLTPVPEPQASAVVPYSAPVPTPLVIVRAFEAPPGPYAAGHRGVDFATTPGQVVRAAGAGRVRFAGPVAGRGVVVIEHPDGVSTEYEPVTRAVAAGARVTAGEPIGAVRGGHGSCPPGRCLHWGARRGSDYFDPMTLLARLGPVRLLPWAPGSAP